MKLKERSFPHPVLGNADDVQGSAFQAAFDVTADGENFYLKVVFTCSNPTLLEAIEKKQAAYVMHVDFGPEIGVRKSSAQVTVHYQPEELVGQLVVGVVNFPKKQIGPLMSECLVTGFEDEDGAIVLCRPERDVPLGAKLC